MGDLGRNARVSTRTSVSVVLQSFCFLFMPRSFLFVEPALGEQDIVVTMTVWCMCVHWCIHPSEFVQTVTSTIVDGFQKNLAQFFSITCRCAI